LHKYIHLATTCKIFYSLAIFGTLPKKLSLNLRLKKNDMRSFNAWKCSLLDLLPTERAVPDNELRKAEEAEAEAGSCSVLFGGS